MTSQNLKKSFLTLTLAFNALPIHAQTLPDAGALRQQIEQEGNAFHPAPTIPEKAALPPLRALTGTTLVVKKFRFSGNTLISSEALQAVVTPYLKRELDFAQLQDVAAAVGKAYREAGWIVRAYLPQQEIEDGVVTIEIIEAVFGGSTFEGKPAMHLSNVTVQKYMESAQKVGEPLRAPAIDRVLLILSNMPGVALNGNLHEGTSAGQTDLVFNVQDKPLLSADMALDNTGSRSTGKARLSGNIYLNSPLGLGDQLITNLMLSEGSGYGRMAYSVPVGYDGWRVGASSSYMTYRLITDELQALHAKGDSSTFGVDANYPIVRSRLRNLYLGLNYDHKNFNNEANQAVTTHYAIDTLSVGLTSNMVDKLLGGGMNNFGLAWVHGATDLDGSPNQATDAATTKIDGQFNKIRYSANRQQVLTENVAVYAAISGQTANKNLDSAEKFYLGGAYGVRAYPSSEGGGSDGQLVNLELRSRLPNAVDVTGFYDWGHVTVNHNNNFIGATTLNNYSLQGLGVSVGWTAGFGLSLKATWAHRIGGNPNPTASGNDQDGSLDKNRIWLQASAQF